MRLHVIDGAVTAEFAAPGIFGAAVLPLPGGGQLRVDPLDPTSVLSVGAARPREARTSLEALVGPQLTDWLCRWQPGSDTADAPPPEPGAEAAPLCRLALATWHARWTPLPIPTWLTQLDVAQASLRGDHHRRAFELFDAAADSLLDLSRHWSDAPLPEDMGQALAEVSREAAVTLGPRHRLAAQLSELPRAAGRAQAAAGAPAAGHPDEMWDIPLPVVALRTARLQGPVRHRAPASHPAALQMWQAQARIREGGELTQRWHCSVDWRNVEPGVLATGEETVTAWRIDGGIEASAEPAPPLADGASAARRLALRAVDSRTGEPAGAAAVRWDRRSGRFRATLPLPVESEEADPRSLILDICSTSVEEPVAVGAEALRRTAERAAIRSLAHARLAVAAASLNRSRASAIEAAAEWAQRALTHFSQLPPDLPGADGWVQAARWWSQAVEANTDWHRLPLPARRAGAAAPALRELTRAPLFSELALVQGL